MSVYNGEKYLREAIDSILNQTFTDFEFLIINDGSADRTAEILQSYRDPRIKIINNEENIGLTKSLNKGLGVARGEYIARQDADDISLPDRLNVQYNYITDDPNLAICASSYEQIDENGNTIKTIEEYLGCEQLYYFLTFANLLAHSTVLLKKSIVLKLNGYDDKLIRAQDYDLWYQASRANKVVQIGEVLLKLRIHQENISSKYRNSQKYIANSVALRNIKQICNDRISTRVIKVLSEWDKEIAFDDVNAHTLINNLIVLNDYLIDLAPSYIDKKKLMTICWDRVYYYLILALKQKKYFSMITVLWYNCLKRDFVTNAISKIPILILLIGKRIHAKS
jgi:glycosyltransferase involved in cell wall biosynthesis